MEVAVFSRPAVIAGLEYPTGAVVPVWALAPTDKERQRRLRQLVEFKSVKMVEVESSSELDSAPTPEPVRPSVPAGVISAATETVRSLRKQLKDAEGTLKRLNATG